MNPGDRVHKRYFEGWNGTVQSVDGQRAIVLWDYEKSPTNSPTSELRSWGEPFKGHRKRFHPPEF